MHDVLYPSRRLYTTCTFIENELSHPAKSTHSREVASGHQSPFCLVVSRAVQPCTNDKTVCISFLLSRDQRSGKNSGVKTVFSQNFPRSNSKETERGKLDHSSVFKKIFNRIPYKFHSQLPFAPSQAPSCGRNLFNRRSPWTFIWSTC